MVDCIYRKLLLNKLLGTAIPTDFSFKIIYYKSEVEKQKFLLKKIIIIYSNILYRIIFYASELFVYTHVNTLNTIYLIK